MKKFYLVIFINFLLGCSYRDIKIEGHAPGIEDAVVEIRNHENRWSENVAAGKFSISAKIRHPDFYQFKLLFQGVHATPVAHAIYLEKGEYTITLDSLKPKSYPIIISASETQDDLSSYFKQKSGIKQSFEKYILAHPASLVSAYLLSKSEKKISDDPKRYNILYNALRPEIKNSLYGVKAGKLITGYVRTMPGAPLPHLEGVTPNGDPLNPGSLKGKLTLIAFWASWNRPSLNDISQLKQYYIDYHDKGFEILSIAIDKYEDRWKKSIQANEMDWLHLADFKGAYSENFEQLNTNMLPCYIIVGPDLKIVDHTVPLESIPLYINDFLKVEIN